jgi:hypothetical protein
MSDSNQKQLQKTLGLIERCTFEIICLHEELCRGPIVKEERATNSNEQVGLTPLKSGGDRITLPKLESDGVRWGQLVRMLGKKLFINTHPDKHKDRVWFFWQARRAWGRGDLGILVGLSMKLHLHAFTDDEDLHVMERALKVLQNEYLGLVSSDLYRRMGRHKPAGDVL